MVSPTRTAREKPITGSKGDVPEKFWRMVSMQHAPDEGVIRRMV
jgi:hypothetical protein